MQERNRVFSDIFSVMNGALHTFMSASEECRSGLKTKFQHMAHQYGFVPEEEFNILKARVEALEAKIATMSKSPEPSKSKTR